MTRQAAQKRFVPGRTATGLQPLHAACAEGGDRVVDRRTDPQDRLHRTGQSGGGPVHAARRYRRQSPRSSGVTVDKFTEKLELPGPAENPPALVPFSADARRLSSRRSGRRCVWAITTSEPNTSCSPCSKPRTVTGPCTRRVSPSPPPRSSSRRFCRRSSEPSGGCFAEPGHRSLA